MSGTVELKTERLILRRYRNEDAEVLHRNFGLDPDMFRYSGWNPYATEEMAEETVREFIGSYEEEHFYGWAVEHGRRMIGTVGAYDYDAGTDSVELGISIERGSWGKGYASEAIACVLKYLTEQEQIKTVKAWCASENIGSAKAMEKAGMKQVGFEPEGLEVEGKKYGKMIFRYPE